MTLNTVIFAAPVIRQVEAIELPSIRAEMMRARESLESLFMQTTYAGGVRKSMLEG